MSRRMLAIAVATAGLALVVPSAAQARGSLRLSVDPPGPACVPEFTEAGDCRFHFTMTVVVHQPKECRTRQINIYRLDPPMFGKLWNTATPPHTQFSEPIEMTALYPGDPVSGADEATGGTKALFRAVAPRMRGFVGPFADTPIICKKLKTPGITEVTVPTPPPPPPY